MSNHAATMVAHKHPSDVEGAKIGMWLFLFTEVLLFGGLFIAYAVYRSVYPEAFQTAAANLDTFIGAVNTLFLLTSSLTVVIAIVALQKDKQKMAVWMIWATVLFALGFMVNKYFEWSAKIHHGIYPGSPELLADHSKGEIVFYNLYYTMTGLHGLHVIIGLIVFFFVLYFIKRRPVVTEEMPYEILKNVRGTSRLAVVSEKGEELGTVAQLDDKVELVDIRLTYEPVAEKRDPRNFVKLENAGLYWHLVDVIWIFLFPLFYLIT
ncbi:MAG: cytochrome c oxidase subunit 3 family protein [Calditrichaeota bacterium]|nr:MAG: cytochrome c oxidase subunit 3 family protein [Calditrichota bacterium]